jgi:hypothetical protein
MPLPLAATAGSRGIEAQPNPASAGTGGKFDVAG